MNKKIIVIIVLAAVLAGSICYGVNQKEPEPVFKLNADIKRVETPDQTESQPNPAFAKEEYVSVLPEGTNIAPDGKADSNGFTQNYVPNKAVDGNTGGASYWEGTPDSYPNNLSVKFKETKTIHAIRVALNPDSIWGKRTQNFSILISKDGETYEPFIEEKTYEFDPDKGNETIIEFDDTEVMGVELEFTANTGAGAGQVAEFEIYSK